MGWGLQWKSAKRSWLASLLVCWFVGLLDSWTVECGSVTAHETSRYSLEVQARPAILENVPPRSQQNFPLDRTQEPDSRNGEGEEG
jgi:hypothetical protein